MGRWRLAAFALAALAAGCGLYGYDQAALGNPDAGSDAAIDENALIVNLLDDRMAGPDNMSSADQLPAGTQGLSLREAVAIANNTPEPTRIAFDPGVFGGVMRGEILLVDSELSITGAGTVLDCQDAVAIKGKQVRVLSTTDVTITGCEFRIVDSDALLVRDSSRVTLRQNLILESGGRALLVDAPAADCSGITIEGNRIEVATDDLVGIYDCSKVTVVDNFMNIGDKGTQRGVHFERVVDSEITNNIIDPGEARLINFQDSSRVVISHNVLDGGDAGVVLYGASNDNLIMMNVAMTMVFDGVYLGAESSNNTVVHNTFFQCSTAIADASATTFTANNLISSDPLAFGDPTPGVYDFSLVPGSDFVDAAEDLGYDCLPDSPARFLGFAPDLGAVETR